MSSGVKFEWDAGKLVATGIITTALIALGARAIEAAKETVPNAPVARQAATPQADVSPQ